jgi:nucleotide-binding universal stress UspA family protein
MKEDPTMFKKILFCTDFSEDSHWAFTYALDLAKTYKARLLIFHVTPEPVHPEQLSLYLAPEKLEELKVSQKREIDRQLRAHYVEKMGRFKNYHISFKEGEPFIEIIQRAKKDSVDLIVMGTHGRTGLDHVLFGSTAEKVVRKSPCPVLTVRLPGRRFSMP